MPGPSFFLEHLRVDALSIVPNPKAKHVSVVSNLGLDPVRVCVPISVSQYFECDPADLILGGRGQGFPLTLFNQLENRWFPGPICRSRQFSIRGVKQFRK